MKLIPWWGAIAAAVACNDPAPVGDTDDPLDTESTSGHPPGSSTTLTSTSTESDGSSGDAETASTDSSSSSSGDESSSSSTGEAPQDGLELLVLANDGDGPSKFFYYRKSDEGVEGPTQVVPPGDEFWQSAHVFDRRVVYFVNRNDDHDLVLGSVDDDEGQVQLDVDPVPAGDLTFHTRVPDAEAVVFASATEHVAYRIDFPDGLPMPPVALGPTDAEAGDVTIVAPDGRWTPLVIGNDVALARVDVPDPDGIVTVSDSGRAAPLGFSSDAASFWFATYSGFVLTQLEHVDVRDDLPDPGQPVHPPLGAGESYDSFITLLPGDGLLYRITDDVSSDETLWWVDVDDGVPTEPIAVLSEIADFFTNPIASSDGRWVAFVAEAPSVQQGYVVDLHSGATPVVYVVDIPAATQMQFSPDTSTLWVSHSVDGTSTLSRVPIGDDGVGEPELLSTPDVEMPIGLPASVTSDGLTMLVRGYMDDAGTVAILDLGGALPATPVVLNAPPPPGEGAGFGVIAPDDEHVLYIQRELFSPEALMIAEIDAPGEADLVTESTIGWQIIP